MARKLIIRQSEFQINHIPLADSPDRVTIVHTSTGYASTFNTEEEAWADVLRKLAEHYEMLVVRKPNVSR